MRTIFFILSFTLTYSLYGQSEKTKNNVDVICNFRLIADTTMVGRPAIIAAYTFEGTTLKDENVIRKKLQYNRGRTITITMDSISNDVKDICVMKKIKLSSITITETDEEPYKTSNGVTKKLVLIRFTYINKTTTSE